MENLTLSCQITCRFRADKAHLFCSQLTIIVHVVPRERNFVSPRLTLFRRREYVPLVSCCTRFVDDNYNEFLLSAPILLQLAVPSDYELTDACTHCELCAQIHPILSFLL